MSRRSPCSATDALSSDAPLRPYGRMHVIWIGAYELSTISCTRWKGLSLTSSQCSNSAVNICSEGFTAKKIAPSVCTPGFWANTVVAKRYGSVRRVES
eukprot:3771403-Rhodomonas_salina.1